MTVEEVVRMALQVPPDQWTCRVGTIDTRFIKGTSSILSTQIEGIGLVEVSAVAETNVVLGDVRQFSLHVDGRFVGKECGDETPPGPLARFWEEIACQVEVTAPSNPA